MAVTSSLKAADTWTNLSGHERACHIYSLARHMQKHATLLAQMESLNRGVQSCDPREFDVPAVVRYLYYYAGWAQLSSSSELRDWKPVGVVAGIMSAVSPLITLAQIVAPALAAGNTVCLKPPKGSPLPALLFANIAMQAGLPPGVINVLPGGSEVGRLLVTHIGVSKLMFSGSTGLGRLIRKQTAGLGIHLTLLLSGGKSSMMVFDSADLDSSVDGAVHAAWFNQGQVPWSVGRLLVQESIWHDFVPKLRACVDRLRVGEAFDHLADVGSPITKDIITSLAVATSVAQKNGLEVYEAQIPPGLSSETFFPPTLVIGGFADSNLTVDDDILLPLVEVVPFRTAKEAIALANNSRYGMAASVWTENTSLALEVAYHLQVGTVWINSHGTVDAGVPFGGWKQSGIGVVGGKEGLLEYMQYKGVRVSMTTDPVQYKYFGMTPDVSVCCPPSLNQQTNKGSVPVVDRTYKLYYGGAYKRPDGNMSHAVLDGTGKIHAIVADGSRKDVRNAVEAAAKAQPAWRKIGAHVRSQIIYNAAEKLQSRREDFISHLTTLYGKSDKEDASKELDACMSLLFHWAASCDKKQFAAGDVSPNSSVVVNVCREPLGIIGIVQAPVQSSTGPWALLGFISLFAPAVCYGNTVVVIADSMHPTPALEFCEVLHSSDFPAGVVNVLTGDSEALLSTLANHQEVAGLWAPQTTATEAKYIEWASSVNLKRIWVDKLPCFTSFEQVTDFRELFELNSTRTKAVWMPCGEIFAN
ncbi:aldehyde dehydrogenase family 16 member A1-like isoform X2 [Zootermopsis nevadensis]|nr:aldehyde dehydrogenase family 16 member A1-like isoform X2 [Zootermopsis nevadensis]